MAQLEKDKGYKFTKQALIRQIQLIDAQGLHPITLRKIMGRQIRVDERSLRLVFQAMGMELEPLDYRPAALQPDEIDPGSASGISSAMPAVATDFPGGPIPLDLPFYIEPIGLLANAGREMSRPGGLVRIRAPQKSGKSSFALRLLHHTETLGYKTLWVDFQQVDEALFSSLDRFLRWFCATLSYQLDLTPAIQEYWNDEVGSKVSCTIYLQKALLKPLDAPVVLVFNEVNLLFEHPAIFREFLPLLRSWYEEAKCHPILQNLRFVLLYSTESYVSLHLNQSPFNIGLPIELEDLNLEEIKRLATTYGLPEDVALPLKDLVGGRPYLVQIGLYYLSHQQLGLEQLLDTAATPAGIYADHLSERLLNLQQDPELLEAFAQILTTDGQIHFSPAIVYKLESLGLIRFDGCKVMASCKLYQQFFANMLGKSTRTSTVSAYSAIA